MAGSNDLRIWNGTDRHPRHPGRGNTSKVRMVRSGRAGSWRWWLVACKGEAKMGSVERTRMVSLMTLKSTEKLYALVSMLEAALDTEM